MNVNLPYEAMTAPILGPSNPYSNRKLGAQQNTLSGHIEEAHMSEFDFRNQQRSFDNLGYAYDPSTLHSTTVPRIIGNEVAAVQNEGKLASERNAGMTNHAIKARTKELKAKRQQGPNGGDTSVAEGEGSYVGPWAGWEGENVHVPDGVGPSEEEIKAAEEKKAERQKDKETMKGKREKVEQMGTEKSIFHGEYICARCTVWGCSSLAFCQANLYTTIKAGPTCTSRPMWTATSSEKLAHRPATFRKDASTNSKGTPRASRLFASSLDQATSCCPPQWTRKSSCGISIMRAIA
jgi:hypothetical protein